MTHQEIQQRVAEIDEMLDCTPESTALYGQYGLVTCYEVAIMRRGSQVIAVTDADEDHNCVIEAMKRDGWQAEIVESYRVSETRRTWQVVS